MTGQDHRAKAEELLDRVAREVERATANTIDAIVEMSTLTIAKAQVHATLALAYATEPVPVAMS